MSLAPWTRAQRLALGHNVTGKPRRQRNGWKFSPQMLRLREIEKLIKHRHRGAVPDPADTDSRDDCMAYVRAAALALSGQDMDAWCRMWAPWATGADILPIAADAGKRRRMMNADGCAGLLGVTMAERTALKLKTIGACDMGATARKNLVKVRKRERDRQRQEEKRREAGRKDRASYVSASLLASKPWEALQMSRRTWYRKGCPTGGTGVSRIESTDKGDTPVPILHEPISTDVVEISAGRAARGDRGSGTVSPAGLQGAEPHGSSHGEMSQLTYRRRHAA